MPAMWRKRQSKNCSRARGHEVIDLGAHSYDALDDYPDFAKAVAEYVAARSADRGVIVCGSGVGASVAVAANKVRGIRASVCHDTYSAHQGRRARRHECTLHGRAHNRRRAGQGIASAFASAEFSGEERHKRRMQKGLRYGSQLLKPFLI